MTAVVRAESLTKRFGEVPAVTDLSFVLEAGTITGFLGPNGAGKTTTLRMILGLVAPTSGRTLVFDHPYARLPGAALRVGAVLEATDFHPGRTGRDHLRMLGQAVDLPDSRADEVLRLVELDTAARRRVKGYSLGMRQRLGLAAALLGDPELLILDEPTSGLDPLMEVVFRDCVKEAKERGQTVFLSSHILSEVEALCDRVGILREGRLVDEGTLEQLRHLAAQTVEVTFAGRAPALPPLTGVQVQSAGPNALRFEVSGSVGPLIAALAEHPVATLTSREPSLEEIFIHHYDGVEARRGK